MAEYAKRAAKGPLIVTQNGKSVAALISVQGMDAESAALTSSTRFVSIIERSRARQKAEGGLSIEAVRQQLGLSRKPRSRRTSGKRR